MIIKDYQLSKITSDNKDFLCILFYGPNEGLVRDKVNYITQHYLGTSLYELINFNAKELDNDPHTLDNILRTVSMFYPNKIVIIESIKEKYIKIIEKIILNPPQKVILIIKSENLSRSSKIRSFFENEKSVFALACYEDDIKSLMKTIDSFDQENKIGFDRDIKSYLLQSLSNDRMISKQELEKIKLFCHKNSEKIELDDIKNLLQDSSSKNLNIMNQNVMNGNTAKSSRVIGQLLSEGTNPISLIRSLINYIMRIQITKIEMRKGDSFENAIKALRPPVFWKDKDIFQKHCMQWPIQSIEKILSNLLEAEIECKLNSKLSGINCEKSILLIANKGREYIRN